MKNYIEKIDLNKIMMMIVGVTILALGVNWFLAPAGMVTGGLSGFSIVVKETLTNVIGITLPLSIITLILNIPLFVIAIKQRGFKFAKDSLVAVVLLSFALWYTEYIPNVFAVQDDLLLTAVFGGVFLGTGIGIVLRTGGTTGGSDMLAAIIKFVHPRFPIQKLMLVIDGFIILSGSFIFGVNNAMYAIISAFITSKVIGSILEGMHFSKAAFIISDKSEEVAEKILTEVRRGATGIKAKGMYSKGDKEMLFVVVGKSEIVKLREVVRSVDKNAFITITDVREVLGEGFIEGEENSLTL